MTLMNTITCRDEAIEVAVQYAELGCPMPVDLTAYLQSEGIITDQYSIDDDDLALNMFFQQEI